MRNGKIIISLVGLLCLGLAPKQVMDDSHGENHSIFRMFSDRTYREQVEIEIENFRLLNKLADESNSRYVTGQEAMGYSSALVPSSKKVKNITKDSIQVKDLVGMERFFMRSA